jgi:hypothetical protein
MRKEEHERAAELCGFDFQLRGLQAICIDFRTGKEYPATGQDINKFASACERLRHLLAL